MTPAYTPETPQPLVGESPNVARVPPAHAFVPTQAAAAEVIRRILIDAIRRKRSLQRGGDDEPFDRSNNQ